MENNDMTRLMAEGGGTVDPVSGNEVPPGALPQEVRDDIDAKLSEGEFVFPADVVRYIGLDRLMQIRDEAKKGLGKMADIGQMGNAQEVENPEALHGDDFDSEIDNIMAEIEGGGEKKMAVGGDVTPSGIEVKQFKDAQGNSTFITFQDGKPMTPIPQGAQEASQQKEIEKTAEELVPTEKARSEGSDFQKQMTMLQDPKAMQKMLMNEMFKAGEESRRSKELNDLVQFDSKALEFGLDKQISDISQAADFKLMSDSAESMNLMSEMDSFSDGMSTDNVTPEPTDMTIDVNEVPTTSEATIEPTMFAAKGGLVTKRKKK